MLVAVEVFPAHVPTAGSRRMTVSSLQLPGPSGMRPVAQGWSKESRTARRSMLVAETLREVGVQGQLLAHNHPPEPSGTYSLSRLTESMTDPSVSALKTSTLLTVDPSREVSASSTAARFETSATELLPAAEPTRAPSRVALDTVSQSTIANPISAAPTASMRRIGKIIAISMVAIPFSDLVWRRVRVATLMIFFMLQTPVARDASLSLRRSRIR